MIFTNSTGSNAINLLNYTAFSYKWWQYLKMHNGKLFFNAHSYSTTTSKHQHKCRMMLSDAGIKIDYFVNVDSGLQDSRWESIAINEKCAELRLINERLAKPRTQKRTKERLMDEKAQLRAEIDELREICQGYEKRG